LPKLPKKGDLDAQNDESEALETMQLKEALSLRAYWTAMTINLVTGMTSFGLRLTLIPLFVIEVLHKSAQTSSMSFLISSVTQALLLLPVGRMIDVRGRKPALIIGCTLLTASLLVLSTSEQLGIFYFSMMLMGAASAFLGATPSAMVGDIVKARRGGQVVGLYQMTGDLGVIVGPLLAGYLKDSTGGYFVPFMVSVFVSVVALAMSVAVRETNPKNAGDVNRQTYETTSS
jgi:MFS family permease